MRQIIWKLKKMDFNYGKGCFECKKLEVTLVQRSLYHVPKGSNSNALLGAL